MLFSYDTTYAICRFFLKILYRIFFIDYSIEGEENLKMLCNTDGHGQPDSRPSGGILFSNHISNLDPVLFMLIGSRRISFMAKRQLFNLPVVGWIMKRSGHFMVTRERADHQAIKTACEKIAAGELIGLFPEGTRSADGTLKPFKLGAAHIAIKARAPLIPAVIEGSDKLLPRNAFIPRTGSVKIKIGPPLDTSEFYSRVCSTKEEEKQLLVELTGRMRQAIVALKSSLKGEEAAPATDKDGIESGQETETEENC